MAFSSLPNLQGVFLAFIFLLIFARAEYGFPNPGEQNPSSTSIMEDLFFVTTWETISNQSFDYVVIGTGFCGYSFVARVLQKNPHARIVMLERGPFFLPAHFQSLSSAFQGTVAPKLESYPWTLTEATAGSKFTKWLHGVAPFFGGRSTKWSGWCPRPTTEEMAGWPNSTIDSAQRYFAAAERMLNVTSAGELFGGKLQAGIMDLVSSNTRKLTSATRVLPAPLSIEENSKFSVIASLLQLILRQQQLAADGSGSELRIVINCVVQQISEQQKTIQTSKGSLLYGDSRIVLAMGAIPPTTLILNSFPHLSNIVGKRMTSHFISTLTAKVPRHDFDFAAGEELAAFYLAGVVNGKQYHVQASVISSPTGNLAPLQHLMPDVLTSATQEQMQQATDSIVFVFAILGEQSVHNGSWIKINNMHSDITANIRLQLLLSEEDLEVWDSIDSAAFEALERVLAPSGNVAYWSNKAGAWVNRRPTKEELRRPGLVHEASSLFIGEGDDAIVDIDYRLKGSNQIYVTGGGLWPRSFSWNPTLTMVALTLDLADKLEK